MCMCLWELICELSTIFKETMIVFRVETQARGFAFENLGQSRKLGLK